MVIASSSYSLRKFPFVDREECKRIFQDFLKTSEQKQYNVLHYYGISGIGKSKLQQELQSVLTKEYSDIIWANVDFKVKTHREIGTFLFSLRSQLAGKHKVKFDHFDIAHAVYWKKVNPEIALAKEKYSPIEEGSIVDIMFKILNIFGPFSLLVDIPNYLAHTPERFKKWWIEEGLRFANSLNEANPNQIDQLLPVFFFTDLQSHLKNKSKKAVFFIDTYEALWEENRNIGNFHEKDEWVRNTIVHFEDVSWITCGREELRWIEADNEWDNYLDQHKIGILPLEYCIEFLESCGVDEKDIQSPILEASESYPYYLALSVDTYLTIKEKGKKPIPEDFPKTRPEIFNSFFHYLDAAEKSTLLILSHTNFWNRNLFNLLIDEFGTNYPKSEMAFEELNRFSFMRENSDGTWSMHSLMKKSLQENQKPEAKQQVHEYLFNYYDQQLNSIDIKKIEEIQKTAFNEAFYHGKQFFEVDALSSWLFERSEIFLKAGLWELLIPLFDEIRSITETRLGSEHPEVATSINNLAELYRNLGKYNEALPLYEQALMIHEKKLGSENLNVAIDLNNLALLYLHMGNYEKALNLSERALEIREKMLGPDHSDVAMSLDVLASVYNLLGMYEKALPLYKRAIEILEITPDSDHPNIATILNNLALVYDSMGNYEEALNLYKRALEIREKTFGQNHPTVAASLNNLALLYNSMGNYEEALPLYKRALKILEKMLGLNHPDVAITLNNLALLYNSTGNYEQALPLYKRVLEILEKVFDPDNPNVATARNNLAELYSRMEKYEEALTLHKQTLAIREKKLGSEHPAVAISLNNITVLYSLMGKYEEALPLCRRALEINKKKLGTEHPDIAINLSNLAELYYHMGNYEEAINLCERAVEINEKALGTNHPAYINTLNILTAFLCKLRQ